jgi:hypothetical protein
MRVQDYVANLTEAATGGLFRNAYAIPTDKLLWCPSDSTRSALDQLQECAQTSMVFAKMLNGEEVDFSPRNFIQARKLREEWTTVEECERISQFNLSQLLEAISGFPTERLEESTMAPWGVEVTYSELLVAQYWNVVWHTGQIAYIQRLLGDKDMH